MGIDSLGQTNPGKNIKGTDDTIIIKNEISRFLQKYTKLIPKKALANKNGTSIKNIGIRLYVIS